MIAVALLAPAMALRAEAEIPQWGETTSQDAPAPGAEEKKLRPLKKYDRPAQDSDFPGLVSVAPAFCVGFNMYCWVLSLGLYGAIAAVVAAQLLRSELWPLVDATIFLLLSACYLPYLSAHGGFEKARAAAVGRPVDDLGVERRVLVKLYELLRLDDQWFPAWREFIRVHAPNYFEEVRVWEEEGDEKKGDADAAVGETNGEEEADAMRKPTLYAFHPHGLFCIAFTQCVAHERFKNAMFLFSGLLVNSPFFRFYASAVSRSRSADKESMKAVMKRGGSMMSGPPSGSEISARSSDTPWNGDVVLPVGGFHEATLTKHGEARAYTKERVGFLKYAKDYGYQIRPVWAEGEEKTYKQFNCWEDARLRLNDFSIPGILPKPAALKNFGLPQPEALNIVIGRPLREYLESRDKLKEMDEKENAWDEAKKAWEKAKREKASAKEKKAREEAANDAFKDWSDSMLFYYGEQLKALRADHAGELRIQNPKQTLEIKGLTEKHVPVNLTENDERGATSAKKTN